MTDNLTPPSAPLAANGDEDPAGGLTPRRYRVLFPLSPRQGPLIPIGAVYVAAYDQATEARMIEIGALRPMADDEPDELPAWSESEPASVPDPGATMAESVAQAESDGPITSQES